MHSPIGFLQIAMMRSHFLPKVKGKSSRKSNKLHHLSANIEHQPQSIVLPAFHPN
ncbi:hypothetical protein [Chlorogloea sp. CCALA 695]|uniref:hypothetical protein n=1 Tax=Chlorogloea sp. CCALA 695 TaxID=2107693 RepID=UPI001304CD32|nr:hypothetical protein [Chlorogloea sp. CCALA 695]